MWQALDCDWKILRVRAEINETRHCRNEWGQSSGSTPPPISLSLRPPHSRTASSPLGLTSSLRRPGLHLLPSPAPDGAQRQHGDPTAAPCGQETERSVPGRWSQGARVWLSEVGWTQTAPSPPHVSRSPASKGTCWQCLLLVSSKAQGVTWGGRLSWRPPRTRAGLVVPGAYPL